jgi:predicted GIY-YIG superfamily endonuclease
VGGNPISFIDPEGLQRGRTDRGRTPRGRTLTPCMIYMLVDCHGEIVYVGVTVDLARRDTQHTDRDVRYIYGCPQCPITMVPTGQVFMSRKDCEDEETNQIRQYKPIFNDAKNNDPDKISKRDDWVNSNCRPQQCP